MFSLGYDGKVGDGLLAKWFRGLGGRIGPRERSHMGIVRLDRLRPVRGCHRPSATFRATTYPNNSTDEPITSFDLTIDAQS